MDAFAAVHQGPAASLAEAVPTVFDSEERGAAVWRAAPDRRHCRAPGKPWTATLIERDHKTKPTDARAVTAEDKAKNDHETELLDGQAGTALIFSSRTVHMFREEAVITNKKQRK